MSESHPPFVFELTGGRVSLDFANTVSGSRGTHPTERLERYEDLLSWARQVGALSDAHAARLLRKARAEPDVAERVLGSAVSFREALYRIWIAHVEKRRPSGADLEVVNARIADALARQRLIPVEGRCCAMAWAEEDALEAPLWPVAKDAADLLTSDRAERVRICEMTAEGECDWLFLDETKNGTRRWCSMRDCGNRAKARRHYQRHRGADRK
jgi:predicted RNA-binding Zn ribbon-like protein